jgi:hypothetical protein
MQITKSDPFFLKCLLTAQRFSETSADHLELLKSQVFLENHIVRTAFIAELVVCARSYTLLQTYVYVNFMSTANEKSKIV